MQKMSYDDFQIICSRKVADGGEMVLAAQGQSQCGKYFTYQVTFTDIIFRYKHAKVTSEVGEFREIPLGEI